MVFYLYIIRLVHMCWFGAAEIGRGRGKKICTHVRIPTFTQTRTWFWCTRTDCVVVWLRARRRKKKKKETGRVGAAAAASAAVTYWCRQTCCVCAAVWIYRIFTTDLFVLRFHTADTRTSPYVLRCILQCEVYVNNTLGKKFKKIVNFSLCCWRMQMMCAKNGFKLIIVYPYVTHLNISYLLFSLEICR